MRNIRALSGLLCLSMLLSMTARADFNCKSKVDDDFQSYGVKNIALVIVGKWKGDQAKVAPSAILIHIKPKLDLKGYEVTAVKSKKELKAAEKTFPAAWIEDASDVRCREDFQTLDPPQRVSVVECLMLEGIQSRQYG